MGFVGLNTAVSGLRAAQLGLAVTGHNMSNAEIYGYSRQRVVQKDYAYQKIGSNAYGPLKRGLGTDWNAVQQIRNEFLDITYRDNVGRLSFYATKTTTGIEIEAMMGELQSAYNFQSVINNMWYAIQELTAHPPGIETRDLFLAVSTSLVTKANEVYTSLYEYQHNLDRQVRDTVEEVNDLVTRVKELNVIIVSGEASGDNANDYRDERNRALDKLSELIPMEYYYDYKGNIGITTMGKEILTANNQRYFGLRQSSSDYPFVEPIIMPRPGAVLPANSPPDAYTAWLDLSKPVNAEKYNDYGVLMGLIVSRGAGPAFHMGIDGLNKPVAPVNKAAYATAVGYNMGTNTGTINVNTYNVPTIKTLSNPDSGFNRVAFFTHYRAAYDAYTNPAISPHIKFPALPAGMMTDADIEAFLNDPQNAANFLDAVTAYNAFAANSADYPDAAAKTDVDYYNAMMHNYHFAVWSMDNCMIPKTMMKLDEIFNRIVTMINDTLAPTVESPPGTGHRIPDPSAPFDNNGNQTYVEVFSRIHYLNRWDDPDNPADLNGETRGNYFSQYSIGNVVVNPKLMDTDGGYNFLALSRNGDTEDTTVLEELQKIWGSDTGPYAIEVGGNYFKVQDAYIKFINQIGTEVSEAQNYVSAQTVQVDQADGKRQSIMGVSLDEEMSNMMKYQYAYQGAARILNVIDSMIDTIVNKMGRAGN